MFGFTRVVRSGSGGAFPDEMQLPPVVRIRLQPAPKPPRGFDIGYKRETAESILELNLSALLNSMSKEKKQRFEEEAKQIAFDRNLARINQWAQGQRDNIDRPKIGHIHRKIAENEQLILDYRSHYGASQLDVIVKYDTWVQLLLESGLGDVCLFVFHNSNAITAFPMKNFEDNKFSPIAKYTQKSGGWGDEKAKATQLRVSPLLSVLLSEIKYDESDEPKFSRVKKYHVAAVGAGKDAGNLDGCKYFSEVNTATEELPLLNGSNGVAYTADSDVSVNNYRTSVSSVSLNISPGKVFGVSSTGQRYYGFRVASGYARATLLITAYDENGAEGEDSLPDVYWSNEKAESDYAFVDSGTQSEIESKVDEIDDQLFPDDYDQDDDVYGRVMSLGTFGTNGHVDWDYTVARTADDATYIGPVEKPDQSSGGVVVSYMGGSVRYQSEDHRVQLETYDLGYSYGKARLSWSFAGESAVASDDGDDYKAEQIIWPPSVNDQAMFKKNDMFYTDWGVFSKFKSWCFISNGDYTLIGIEADDNRTLYEDTTIFSKVAPFVSGEIQCVWMDVPLSRLAE